MPQVLGTESINGTESSTYWQAGVTVTRQGQGARRVQGDTGVLHEAKARARQYILCRCYELTSRMTRTRWEFKLAMTGQNQRWVQGLLVLDRGLSGCGRQACRIIRRSGVGLGAIGQNVSATE